jgi:K+-transporting ATPase KdpF subunit
MIRVIRRPVLRGGAANVGIDRSMFMFESIVGLVAVALLIYLFFTLLRPEKF